MYIKDFGNLPKLFKTEYFIISGESTYRPVVTFTYFVDYALYGLRPWGFHLTNIVLHSINCGLLYIFLTLIAKALGTTNQRTIIPVLLNPSIIVSLLFAVHPILTEAVNSISFREDMLAFSFYITTMNIYILLRSERPSKYRNFIYFISCLTYFLAVLSKEMAVTLPLVICCYELVLERRSDRIVINSHVIGYFACTLVYGYLRFSYFYNPFEYDIVSWKLSERLLTMPWVYLNFLKLILFPLSLSADYEIKAVNTANSDFIVPFIAIILLITTAIKIREKKKLISFGIFSFFIILMPVSNIIPIFNPFAERYLYLPTIGVTIISGSAIHFIYENIQTKMARLSMPALFLLLLGIFSLMVVNRNGVWRDDFSLWSDATRKNPLNSWPHHNLGVLYSNQGKIDEAIRELETAIKMKSSNPTYFYNLGIAYNKKGQPHEALEQYKIVLMIRPNYPDIHDQLGVVFDNLGLVDESIREYKTALKEKPYSPSIHNNLGYAYFKQGLLNEALQEYQIALKLNPNYALAINNVGNVYFMQAKIEEALREYRRAANIDLADPMSRTNIGLIYSRQGKIEEAIQQYHEALVLNQNFIDARYNLGIAYLKAGQRNEALKEFETVLRLRPDHLQTIRVLETIKKPL